MMLFSPTRGTQLLLFSVFTYISALLAVYFAVSSSTSYLQVTIKLTQGLNVIIFAVFSLLNSSFLWKAITHLLFGELRLIEYEHIIEKLPFAIINIVLMFSTLNEQNIIFTCILFGGLLLYMKVSNWILRDRLEALAQTFNDSVPIISIITSNRFFLNMALFAFIDYQIITYCLTNSLKNSMGASTSFYLLLGVEFLMLLVNLLNLFLHACLNLYELHRSSLEREAEIVTDTGMEDTIFDDDGQFSGLEGKFMYENAIDVFTRFLKTIIHVLMLIPLRMQFMTLTYVFHDILELFQSSSSLWRTWRNNKQLDDKLPNLHIEDMKNWDNNICIVCMDDLFPIADVEKITADKEQEIYQGLIQSKKKPKKLPCGHILHLNCLKNWMERSQTCPICRLPVFDDRGDILPPAVSASSEGPSPSSVETGNNFEQLNSNLLYRKDSNKNSVEENVSINIDTKTRNNSIEVPIPTPTAPLDTITIEREISIDSVAGENKIKENNCKSSTWAYFKISSTDAESVSFKIVDSNNEQYILPAKLKTIDKLIETSKKSDNAVQQIVIKNEYIKTAAGFDTIDALKKRISD